MSRVELIHVNKHFGLQHAVRDVNLDMASGEFVSIVGGSGCGKTTTLRMIAGFETPSSGEIRIDGRVVNQVPVQDRGVGIVFQSYALFPTMTVAENVRFGLEMARVAPAERQKRVTEVLGLVQLGEFGARYPWQLSGGQQQRVALARALALAPKVLLLDEPLSALDAKIRQSLRSEIRRIQQEMKITTLYVTHDQEEALAIADRIVVMDKGMIQQVGSARAVYDQPGNPFVAGFVGVSNRFEAERLGPQRVRVQLSGGAVEWPLMSGGAETADAGGRGQAGPSRALVTIRPERMRVGPVGSAVAADVCQLMGRMGVRTFLGSSWRIEVFVGSERVLVDVPREGEAALEGLGLDAPVVVSFRPEDARCFTLSA